MTVVRTAFSALLALSAGAAFAQPPAKPVARPVVATHSVVTHSVTKTTTAPRRMAAATTKTRLVTTRTATGQTVTYDCGKAGNAAKKACHA